MVFRCYIATVEIGRKGSLEVWADTSENNFMAFDNAPLHRKDINVTK